MVVHYTAGELTVLYLPNSATVVVSVQVMSLLTKIELKDDTK